MATKNAKTKGSSKPETKSAEKLEAVEPARKQKAKAPKAKPKSTAVADALAPQNAPAARGKKARKPTPQELRKLTLTESELLRMRLYRADTERHNKQATLLTLQREAFIRQIDPEGRIGKMANDIRVSTGQVQAAQKQYQDVVAAVEARLNVTLADYSYDDETGALTRIFP